MEKNTKTKIFNFRQEKIKNKEINIKGKKIKKDAQKKYIYKTENSFLDLYF